MPEPPFLTARLLCCLILLAPGTVLGFGAHAHRVIAELAESRLEPDVSTQIRDLLAGEVETTLAGVATWADQVREGDDPRFAGTAPWHYVNFPRDGACRYKAPRDCPDGACIVAALQRQAATLGDRTRDRGERAQALKWVVHLVGDIHQPLHAGFGDDRGGNLFQLHYVGQGTNLHAVWDRLLFDFAGLEMVDHTALLRQRPIPDATLAWRPHSTSAWAEESCRLIGQLDLYPQRRGRLDRAYLERMLPHAQARVQLAGLRLASLLNEVLAACPTRDRSAADGCE